LDDRYLELCQESAHGYHQWAWEALEVAADAELMLRRLRRLDARLWAVHPAVEAEEAHQQDADR
jgi:hypothetical protein